MNAPSDVIVVGAGMAGLKAAGELVEHGRSVVVLEADSRVGGRTKFGQIAGRVADYGGQWVGAGHSVLLAEAERLGIETYRQHAAGKSVTVLAGKHVEFSGAVPRMSPLALLELAMLQQRWDREMMTVPAEAPWTALKAREWDGQTLESWIRRNLRTAEARAFARLVPRGAWCAEASQVSYLWFLDALRSGQGLNYLMSVEGGALEAKFKGGMNQIAQRLANELGDRLILDAPARRIHQDDQGVRIVSDKGEFSARFAIVAVPPGPTARIAFEPHLPAARDGLAQRMPMGAIIKAAVAYPDPFWRTRGFSGQVATEDDVLGIVMDDVQDDNGPPVLLCFIEGPRALALSGADKAERREKVVASLVRYFGPEAAHPLAYDDNDWMVEPWTHGYVGTMPPGVMTRYGHALREPCGRIHWASSETATEWAGYIEGALRSGVRAAAEVAARHNA
ncbi:MAG TPA: flavin monoamine oxidase family protein [Caulobacteraceae bacterium]|jgi:monoamine oxidase|nr:flavin monoamine oxidase family protein [Caulobacteraceae bacterium]